MNVEMVGGENVMDGPDNVCVCVYSVNREKN